MTSCAAQLHLQVTGPRSQENIHNRGPVPNSQIKDNLMGVFSWLTADTKESIAATMAGSLTHPVRTTYLYLPEGGHLTEDAYEGDGVFAGQDAYALLARWNAPEQCSGNPLGDRSIGIDLFYASVDGENGGTEPPLAFPLKFSFSPDTSYQALGPSPVCPWQGYFYDDGVAGTFEGEDDENA